MWRLYLHNVRPEQIGMALRPVCVLVLPESLGPAALAGAPPFGPAMNLAEQARHLGVRCIRIAARPLA